MFYLSYLSLFIIETISIIVLQTQITFSQAL